MHSLRYWRFTFCKEEKGSQANLGLVSTVSHHFAEQVHKTEIEKAHVITREGGAHSQLLSCSHLSRLPDRYEGPGTDRGAQGKTTMKDPSHFKICATWAQTYLQLFQKEKEKEN